MAAVNAPTDEAQDCNNAGGFVYQLSDFDRFKRFLILGSNSNTYYATAQKLTVENAAGMIKLLGEGVGERMVEEILTVSLAGRAPKQAPALFALAVCLVYSNAGDAWDAAAKAKRKVRRAALAALPRVCRTASTLYELMAYYKLVNKGRQPDADGLAGFGHAVRRAVGDWFLAKSPEDVAFQIAKYPQRHGIAARDLLRLSHPRAADLAKRGREGDVAEMALVLHHAARPAEAVEGDGPAAALLRDAALLKKGVKDVDTALQIIERRRGLGWEHIGDTKLLRSPRLWAALLRQGLGMTALLRNLRRLQQLGLLGPKPPKPRRAAVSCSTDSEADSASEAEPESGAEAAKGEQWTPDQDYLQLVADRITDAEQLRAARVHPIQVLLATVAVPEPAPRLVAALDAAFEASFAAVQPAGARVLLALDVSGSMGQSCCGADALSCAMAAAAIAMILVRKEPATQVVAFSDRLVPLPIGPEDGLQTVMARAAAINFGATDCSLPMAHARQQGLDVDAFVVLTDNETWRGEHAAEELRRYRAAREPLAEGRRPARLLVGAFAATGFSIADPRDPGMLDVAGLDASLPAVMRAFLAGEL